jgi:hypothetical protein
VETNAFLQDFFWFVNAVVKWQTPSSELDDMFRKVGHPRQIDQAVGLLILSMIRFLAASSR